MRRFLLIGFIVLAGGCAQEKSYPPRAIVPQVAGEPDSGFRPGILEKVGSSDYSKYGIPLYPGSKVVPGSDLSGKAKASGVFRITLESNDPVSAITNWYKDAIKATQAFASHEDLGAMEGTTRTNLHIAISIAKVDKSSMIAISVDEPH
jgi:hypothetical protein